MAFRGRTWFPTGPVVCFDYVLSRPLRQGATLTLCAGLATRLTNVLC